MKHSSIVGGSTASRVMNCPGSVPLVQQMPPAPASKYAEEGSMLHEIMDGVFDGREIPETLTPEQREKIDFCIAAMDEIDPTQEMLFNQEVQDNITDDIFGNADLVGRIGNRAIVLDWKFGDGVAVEAEENAQGLFYAAAAMKTEAAKWAFDGATEVEIIIVQPPVIKRWVTTIARVKQFEMELLMAVKEAQRPEPRMKEGKHCRWCAAKPICPVMTGAADRALKVQMDAIDTNAVSAYLQNADLLEQWIADLRALAHRLAESGRSVPGYKLVAKRATRQWADEAKVKELYGDEVLKTELLSPAQMEKVLKKSKMTLPDDLVVAVSSGNTLVPESDPRPPVVQIGQTLVAALSKLN